jgi:regulator of protease activity HflC (stomatin/prohibitin superfamily)
MELIIVSLLVGGAALALASLRRIPEDTVCTVHRRGRYVRTLTPGFRFTIPLLDKIAHRVRLVGHQIDLPSQPFAGHTDARGEVFYQILEPELARDALDDVDALVQREARVRLAAIALHDSVPESGVLSGQLKRELNEQLGGLGLRITRCQVRLTAAA